jgi:hypothetical protein
MPTLADRIIELLRERPELSDREITDMLVGRGKPQQSTNQCCRRLATRGQITRHMRADGTMANCLSAAGAPASPTMRRPTDATDDPLCEDGIKRALDAFLQSRDWRTVVAWGKSHGVDVEACHGVERWIIEVKGRGSRPEMRVNYFVSMLGELIQRMNDPNARYSIALPDLPQFRRLWERLPDLAKARTGITALFVDATGNVEEPL